jgi:hypothetical protein
MKPLPPPSTPPRTINASSLSDRPPPPPFPSAFEIAAELHAQLDGAGPLPPRASLLLLLAHFRPDMLAHSCRDIAAAAVLTALRAAIGPAAADARLAAGLPTLAGAVGVRACAGRMWAICLSGLPLPGAEAWAGAGAAAL